MLINLKKLQQNELLSRFGDDEQHITLLTQSTEAGWQPILAWNPADILEIPYDAENIPSKTIEEFVNIQRTKSRLIVGYLSYDLGCLLHNVKLSTDDDLKTPLAYIMSFDNWISWDNGIAKIHSKNNLFIDQINEIIQRPERLLPTTLYDKSLFPASSRQSYDDAYNRVHDYIEAGDIYQANLTHRLQGITQARGIDIYRKVSNTSHADFQSYIVGKGFEVISASPERFVQIKNGMVETCPIKGTRPRGKDDADDETIRRDLESNPKDKAELDMITDLMRNDLGAISEIGSVEVVKRRVLKAYPTLWHAHSIISSRLKADISPITALLSLMPGGSITGCPKKRAMEIIDEVEDKRRGIYTGSIFTINPNGDLDSNIAIRTMIKKADQLYLSVGGGIVYDSKQGDEYDESLQKAAAFVGMNSKN